MFHFRQQEKKDNDKKQEDADMKSETGTKQEGSSLLGNEDSPM